MNYPKILRALSCAIGLSALLSASVSAALVVDYSPDTTTATVVQSSWENQYGSQIIGDRFTLTQSTILTGGAIFSDLSFGVIGDSARFMIFSDSSGTPTSAPLFDISTSIDAVDTQLTTSASILSRKHATISGITLAAGDYWFALAGEGVELAAASGGYGDGSFQFGSTSLSNTCTSCGDMFFTLDGNGGGTVPEPGSLVLMGIAMTGLAAVRRKRNA